VATTWEELGARALARQFPDPPPGGVGPLVAAVGPLQTQTARSAFLGLAARAPGLTHDLITRSYEQGTIVRGSTIRGTVHTATPEQHGVLGLATRIGLHRHWARQLRLDDDQVRALWAATEEFAREWRTPDELRQHLAGWLARHASAQSRDLAATPVGRHLAFAHGGLVRRPASGERWEGQGAPVYRTLDPAGTETLADVVRLHLSCHGPSSRHDIAWWSGLRLGVVDEALAALDLVDEEGPDGRRYLDLPAAPAPRDLPGVRLLAEFDALLCGYDPRARERFVTPAHHRRLWNAANGLLLAPLLVDGRISGSWRIPGHGSSRPLEVTWFARTRRPRRAELEAAAAALEAALAITVTGVTITREAV
jgi:hypothetical protein